jgi:hypothetical protein
MSKRSAAKDGSAAYTAYQQRRRAAALERQKAARQNVLHELRSLAAAATQVIARDQGRHCIIFVLCITLLPSLLCRRMASTLNPTWKRT